jgi:hypothetical protein
VVGAGVFVRKAHPTPLEPTTPPSGLRKIVIVRAPQRATEADPEHQEEGKDEVGGKKGEGEENEGQLEVMLEQRPLQVTSLAVQAARMLSHELMILFFALLAISIAEKDKFVADSANLGVWATMFEISSAYGTVGLSLGYTNSWLSNSSYYSPFSQLVIICVMVAGRMRKLPLSIDPAVRVRNVVQLELESQEHELAERARFDQVAAAARAGAARRSSVLGLGSKGTLTRADRLAAAAAAAAISEAAQKSEA